MESSGVKPENLKELIVRPIIPGEEKPWNALMTRHHYLGFQSLTGQSLKYVALLDGQWVALIGWGSGVLKCSRRDQWIGWSEEQKLKRLRFVANNQRYLILPDVSIKNLASRTLALNVKRLSADWETVHGHPILVAETFVDHSRFQGTCYRAAGWIVLGRTSGYGRKRGIYYYHGETKTVLVKPLLKKVADILSAPFLPPELEGGKRAMVDLNTVTLNREQMDGLLGLPRYCSLTPGNGVASGIVTSLHPGGRRLCPTLRGQELSTLSANGQPT
jgi:hypothetical protein